MPAIDEKSSTPQPMTIRGADGRVYKTPLMELNARGALASDPVEKPSRSWFGMLMRAPD